MTNNDSKTRLKYRSYSHLNLKLRWNFGLNNKDAQNILKFRLELGFIRVSVVNSEIVL